MRVIKRWWRRTWGEYRNRLRREAVRQGIAAYLEIPAVSCIGSGSRGHDSIYRVDAAGATVGMLRLLNPWRERAAKKGPAMPFRLLPGPARIEREKQAYQAGAASGLTPKPLWSCDDALLSAYLPLRSLHSVLVASPQRAWELIMRVTPKLGALHALGLTHMDVSLANVLADEMLTQIVFVDFEYGPAENISPAQQRVYDHLRLVESTWKFIPAQQRDDFAEWLRLFDGLLDNDMRRVDLAPLAPALNNILSDKNLGPALRRVFQA